MKFKVTTIPDTDNVRLELYVDRDNTGSWVLEHSFVDMPGLWPSSKSVPTECNHSNGDTVLGARNVCFLRTDGNDYSTEVHWRDVSLSKIVYNSPTSLPSTELSEFPSISPTIFPTNAPSIEPSPHPHCYEKVKDKYLTGFKKTGAAKTFTCRKLAKEVKVPGFIESECQKTRSADGFLPAKEVCRVTCGTCPRGCGEIDKTRFYFGLKNNGESKSQTCQILKQKKERGASDKNMDKWCNTEDPNDTQYPMGKDACPVTCGVCT